MTAALSVFKKCMHVISTLSVETFSHNLKLLYLLLYFCITEHSSQLKSEVSINACLYLSVQGKKLGSRGQCSRAGLLIFSSHGPRLK